MESSAPFHHGSVSSPYSSSILPQYPPGFENRSTTPKEGNGFSWRGPAGPGRHHIKKHACQVCLKLFSRPSALASHMSVHTGTKSYLCPDVGCGRRFSVSSNMKRHMRSHLASDTTPHVEGSANDSNDLTDVPIPQSHLRTHAYHSTLSDSDSTFIVDGRGYGHPRTPYSHALDETRPRLSPTTSFAPYPYPHPYQTYPSYPIPHKRRSDHCQHEAAPSPPYPHGDSPARLRQVKVEAISPHQHHSTVPSDEVPLYPPPLLPAYHPHEVSTSPHLSPYNAGRGSDSPLLSRFPLTTMEPLRFYRPLPILRPPHPASSQHNHLETGAGPERGGRRRWVTDRSGGTDFEEEVVDREDTPEMSARRFWSSPLYFNPPQDERAEVLDCAATEVEDWVPDEVREERRSLTRAWQRRHSGRSELGA